MDVHAGSVAPESAAAPEKTRNLQLDVLRGVAILLVFGRHLEVPRPEGVFGVLAEGWFRVGWLGVDLFFALSGFLIGGLLLSEVDKHGSIHVPRFLMRRGLKIYPAYLVFMGYLMLMPTAKAVLRGDGPWTTFQAEWAMYWPNLLFLQNYVGSNPAGHTWTLAVEEHFYLALPFVLVALVARQRTRWLVPLCLVVVPSLVLGLRCLAVWTHDSFYERMSATHLRLDALLFGVGVRAVAEHLPDWFAATRRWRAWLVVAGLGLWSVHLFVPPTTALVRTVGLTGNFFGSAAILLAAYHTRSGDFGRYASGVSTLARMLARIGIYSYTIYLWHVTVVRILERELAGRVLASTGPTPLAWIACVTCIVVAAVVVGAVASKVVEWPVLRVRDRFFPSRSGTLPVGGSGRSDLRPGLGMT